MNSKITKIEKQAKRDRYNIYLDGIYGFSVSKWVLASYNLSENQELSGKEIEEVKKSDIENKAYNRATLILSYRANTEQELKKKLRKNFDEAVVDRAIQKLKKQGFLNDNEFAERYVENSKKGKKMVKIELFKKGLNKELIERAINTRNDKQELKNAQKLTEKTLKKYINESEIVKRKKLYEALTRRGFSYDIYKEIIKDLYLGSG
ncbi:hypothetical protein C4544_02275 [candidate division WS5 bacterium]|uniref:Regulatory protein RecX n=1 Tax=candidate division WS5 bacterium TaxID=2093353 RepID=A0A419DEN0_9BACT|nr:MAG: hypothetical protein C4544_02275 [candidate division WS5 bacterium]